MKTYLKCISVSLFFGVFETLFYLESNDQIVFSDIIFQFSFLKTVIQGPYIIDMTLMFFPYLIFQILFGTYIYQHFCSASVYYFSRCSNRVAWLLKEVLRLYSYVLIYLGCLIGGGLIVAGITHAITFDLESFILFFYYLLIYSLYLYLTVVLINILAIIFNSSTAFVIVAGFEMAFILLLVLWEKFLPLHDSIYAGRNSMLLQLNPVAHLVLAWHSSFLDKLNAKINVYSISFDLNISILLFLGLSILVTVIGCKVVKKKDFIIANNETGGI